MKVWVTRDKTGYWSNAINLNDYKMEQDDEDGCFEMRDDNSPHLMAVGKTWFKRKFGFTPRKGSCKQMNLSLTEIV